MITNANVTEILDYIHESITEAEDLEPWQQAGWFRQTLDSVAWLLKLHSEPSE